MTRRRLSVELEGMVAVHAVRAVRTALAGVPGVVTAEVSMAGAVLETDGPVERHTLEAALAVVGVGVRAVREERAGLPVLPEP